MSKVIYLNNIKSEPKRGALMTRLGYKKGTTELDSDQQEFLENGLKKGALLCEMKGAYTRLNIKNRDEESIELENGVIFKSKGLQKFVGDTTELFLMASTAGNGVVQERDVLMIENPSLGVIVDAVASETTDAGLDWMQEFLDKMLSKEGRKTTKRFSAGYGDLDLSAQKDIYDTMELDKVGIQISDAFILTPEKSVFAICGTQALAPASE